MKISLLLISLFVYFNSISQNIIFPDSILKKRLIQNGVDTNQDGEISINEATPVKSLDISYGVLTRKIKDLGGLEYFTNLDSLDCSNNRLTSIPTNMLNNLEYLSCGTNYLTKLDLSHKTKLKFLDATGLQYLDSLNFGTNDSLKEVVLHYPLVNNDIDFSGLPNLEKLDYLYPRNLDLTNNSKLKYLFCPSPSGIIDVSNNPNLEYLYTSNQRNLDLRNSPKLKFLRCIGIYVNKKLDSINLSKNINLEHLELQFNNLKNIDLSNNTALQFIHLSFNQLSDVDFSNNINTKQLNCIGFKLEAIDVTGLTVLDSLSTGNFIHSINLLDRIDVSTNINLKKLYVQNSNLTVLDVSNNQLLEKIYFGGNDIDSLNLCNNSLINYLHFEESPNLSHIFIPDTNSKPAVHHAGSNNWKFYQCEPIGIKKNTVETSINLYPNPTLTELHIDGIDLTKGFQYEIINIDSEKVLSGKLIGKSIYVESLPPSIYIVRIVSENDFFVSKKFIKK
ncbi:T9SS type A sorting domain-containing protein [Acidiluteibacter ferrifornacis]|uniref:T9SS type A sorting domain-containing protein n=1 Tax=Acidiluteibacter ferrifornacis TaxID=2692424 RepID=A0A6N9NQN2_9FLAO|nr:T9SS type A sorting domain-containing protein [Acidiluteibacter ferrifornacis]NBG67387.1 T9SS type A sorting domain-containing protein [Acidiluteibacter ferrifornacis]